MAEIAKTTIKSISGKSGSKRQLVNVDSNSAALCELYIKSGSKIYQPLVEEGVQWETERKGSPGKLTFTIVDDGKVKFDYGSVVQFKFNQKKVFYGYLFKINPTKDGLVQMTAYDQLRYFKNKHTYVYKNKRLDQLVKMIATDFKLNVGTLANTKYAMSRVEDNQTLLDIVQNSADDTVLNTGNLFVLYDDFGKLTLKNVADMKLTHLIDEETAQDYDYTGSIDDETYNKIMVYYDKEVKHGNDTEVTREFYIAQNGTNQNKWGVLQKTEKATNKKTAKSQAKSMLNMYNSPTRTLKITEAYGNVKVRGGVYIPVMLDLYDTKISNYMMVEKAVHTFNESEHTMDLTLIGNTFME